MSCFIATLFPLTKETMSNYWSQLFAPTPIRISKFDITRVDCLISFLNLLVIGPLYAVKNTALYIYKKKALNPLDMAITLVAFLIFNILKSFQCLLGAIIHPSIAFCEDTTYNAYIDSLVE